MLYFEAVHQYTPASKIFMEWYLKQNSKPWNKVIIYKEKSVYREYIILFGIWLFVCSGATEKNKQLIEMQKKKNKNKNSYNINKLSIKYTTSLLLNILRCNYILKKKKSFIFVGRKLHLNILRNNDIVYLPWFIVC